MVNAAAIDCAVRRWETFDDLLAVCQEVANRATLVPCKDGGKDAYEGEPGSMLAGKWRVESSVDGWIVALRAAIAKATGGKPKNDDTPF